MGRKRALLKRTTTAIAFSMCAILAAGSANAQTCPLTKVIARGGQIHGSNGLAIDSEGQLRIASYLGNEIVAMDRDSGEIGERRAVPEAPGPDDVVLRPDGSLYWTSLGSGSVARLKNGQVTTQFVAPGANAIRFSADGRLFVGLDFLGDGLYEVDPELTTPPRAIVPNTPGQYPLGFLNAFDFGPDGLLYGPLWALGLVVSIDVRLSSCNQTLSPWTDCAMRVIATGLSAPSAVKFDGSGRLYFNSWGEGKVYRVSDPANVTTPVTPELVATLSPGLDNLVFDAGGRLFVSNAQDGSITRIAEGWVERLSTAELILPGGVAVIDQAMGLDNLFVADHQTLRGLSPASGKLLTINRAIPAVTVLQPPTSVSRDGGNLVLASWLTAAVQVWDPQAQKVVESHAVAPPWDAVRFQGALVASTSEGRVARIDTGETILGLPNVYYPLGLAASGDVLYVSDWLTGLVWKVDRSTGSSAPSLVTASPFANPEGLALDRSGGLLVVESGAGRLSRVDLTTGEVATIVDGLAIGLIGVVPAAPPHLALNGVAVGSSGDIFVSGDKDNVLYRIKPSAECEESSDRALQR